MLWGRPEERTTLTPSRSSTYCLTVQGPLEGRRSPARQGLLEVSPLPSSPLPPLTALAQCRAPASSKRGSSSVHLALEGQSDRSHPATQGDCRCVRQQLPPDPWSQTHCLHHSDLSPWQLKTCFLKRKKNQSQKIHGIDAPGGWQQSGCLLLLQEDMWVLTPESSSPETVGVSPMQKPSVLRFWQQPQWHGCWNCLGSCRINHGK